MLIAGGTSNGKTALVNAMLASVAAASNRVALIEDPRELQCAAPNLVALRTKTACLAVGPGALVLTAAAWLCTVAERAQ